MIAGSWQERWQAIVDKLRIVGNPDQEKQLLDELSRATSPIVVGFVNAHAMNSVVADRKFFDALSGADILLRDGSGMAMLYRHLGFPPGLNMNGTDLIPKIISTFSRRRVALWGTQEPFLALASARCVEEFRAQVVSLHHGFDAPECYVRMMMETKPDLIVLGMGMPKQELVAASVRSIGLPVVVVCGGAILDFLGGKVTRAPVYIRKIGIEWLYRLLLEPKRLFKRYVMGNPAFLLRLLLWR